MGKSPESAKLIMGGWATHYNFFRPHMSLKGKTPAEAAGIRKDGKGQEWVTQDQRAERTQAVIYAWRAPEFWGPKGLGCAHCHERPPDIFGLPFGNLCFDCLVRCLPGWDTEQVIRWLGKQRGAYVRQGERTAAVAAYRESGDMALALDYESKYDMWLLDRTHP